MRVGVILLAAGAGRRMGSRTPKAFLNIIGRPLFLHSLATFRRVPGVIDRVLVVPPEWGARVVRRWGDLLRGAGVAKVVGGGARRQDSVGCGLAVLDPSCDVVLVHDTARPFATPALAARVARAAAEHGAAVPGLPVKDTIKRVRGVRVVETLKRDELVAVQTPQGARAALLRRAYASRAAKKDATDDVQLIEWLGGRVVVVEGEAWNLKITSREDVAVADRLRTDRSGGRRAGPRSRRH